MTITRQAARKIRFDEEGNGPDSLDVPSSPPAAPESSDGDDSDSDAAPEEESVSTSKKAILEQQKKAQEAEKEKKKQAREKRKLRDLENQKQKQHKAKPEEDEEEELPEFLDDDFVDAFNQEFEAPEPKNKHIRLDNVTEAEWRRQAKLDKLAALKQSRGAVLKRGPVYVAVDAAPMKKTAPKQEASVMATRDQWLNRKALSKK
ncbi:U3 small nucleolar RNA-associated protein 16 [Diutina catenulata]